MITIAEVWRGRLFSELHGCVTASRLFRIPFGTSALLALASLPEKGEEYLKFIVIDRAVIDKRERLVRIYYAPKP